MQSDILSWSKPHREAGASTQSPVPQAGDEILWLTGPAGTGKTAVMGTMSDILEKEGHLAANFYFSSAMGAAGTTSKQFFVTTLAYQMAVHPGLKDKLNSLILEAVRENPAIFVMSLTRQLELLILEPLRRSQDRPNAASPRPTCILVDGVDECGGTREGGSGRSREQDQIEILSVLLQAVNDPAFPFRVIVASRPETWIRRHLFESAPGRVREIFLDEKYSPNDDIRLYMKSKFSEKCRRCGLDPSAWPPEEDIAKLVENASGQFIYASTVIRFVDTPGASPQAQLNAVLNPKIDPEAKSNPFAMLDALYSSILKSTPSPDTAVLWLQAIDLIRFAAEGFSFPPSAWTIDRCFESYEGQAQSVLGGLPSLLHTVDSPTDFKYLERHLERPTVLHQSCAGWYTCYAFYHKSFLDYLGDDMRYGVAFPEVARASSAEWLGDRLLQVLNRKQT